MYILKHWSHIARVKLGLYCLKRVAPLCKPDTTVDMAIKHIENWLLNPTEENTEACEEFGHIVNIIFPTADGPNVTAIGNIIYYITRYIVPGDDRTSYYIIRTVMNTAYALNVPEESIVNSYLEEFIIGEVSDY